MPTEPLASDKVNAALLALYGEVDAEAGRLLRLHGGRLTCRNGCSGCCVDGLTVFEAEADNIRRRHGELLAGGRPHPAGRCAFLGEAGSCRIYAQRPYVCRTQGLPLRWTEERPDGSGVELRDICPLNEAGEPLEALPEAACFTLGPFEGRLARLQAGVDGGILRRLPLRALFQRPPTSPDA